MKRGKALFVMLLAPLLLLGGGGPAGGQGPKESKAKRSRTAEDYKPRTLKEVAAAAADARGRGNKGGTMVVQADILPSRVRAAYAGSSRPLPRIKAEVIRQWARLYAGSVESYTEPYETELLFEEGGAEHWLAVRKRDLPRLERQLKKGDASDLYLIRLGAARVGAGWEPVLLAEIVRKPD